MTQDAVAKLSDSELGQVIAWAQAEQKMRAERHKQDTIAKIRELAREVGIGIAIEGARGRPGKASHPDTIRKKRAVR